MNIRKLDDHVFATDFAPTQADRKLGNELATVIGELVISDEDPPVEQWADAVRTLRVHGLTITEAESTSVQTVVGMLVSSVNAATPFELREAARALDDTANNPTTNARDRKLYRALSDVVKLALK